jgi:DNA-binding NarL/FixJ family response regulator
MSNPQRLTLAGKYRILIVDDHPVVRQGLMHMIAHEPDIEVCGEAESVTQAIQEVKARKPDLVIVDISLKDSHGLELIRHIKASDENVKMLVWSMYDEGVYAARALHAGAMGYVNKQAPTEDVVQAIRLIHRGEVYLSDELASLLLPRGGTRTPQDDSMGVLSDRELQVFELIGQGMTTREIARQLDVRPKTVEAHRENIKRKLRLKNSAELNRAAVVWMLESG